METAEHNAIRATARQCWKEIQGAWKAEEAKSVGDRNIINRRILKRYERKITPKFTLSDLIYHIGVINGTLKER